MKIKCYYKCKHSKNYLYNYLNLCELNVFSLVFFVLNISLIIKGICIFVSIICFLFFFFFLKKNGIYIYL